MSDIQTITLTPWYGGECPVPRDTGVVVRLRRGEMEAGYADAFDWTHLGGSSDVVAWAAIRTEVARLRVDRSARGPVVVGCENGPRTYRDARDDGLYDGYHRVLTWNECQNLGYIVRRLTAADLEVQDE